MDEKRQGQEGGGCEQFGGGGRTGKMHYGLWCQGCLSAESEGRRWAGHSERSLSVCLGWHPMCWLPRSLTWLSNGHLVHLSKDEKCEGPTAGCTMAGAGSGKREGLGTCPLRRDPQTFYQWRQQQKAVFCWLSHRSHQHELRNLLKRMFR